MHVWSHDVTPGSSSNTCTGLKMWGESTMAASTLVQCVTPNLSSSYPLAPHPPPPHTILFIGTSLQVGRFPHLYVEGPQCG